MGQYQALSEYSSIATFAKFSLQLMSIGAPLWFIKLSNDASLDEIRHSEISLDIANMYLGQDECVIFDVFPQHVVDIDGNWNEIAKETAIGGCIGETLSALNMIMNEYLQKMAMDEIRHSALAWVTVKWMIDNSPNNVVMDVKDEKWWNERLDLQKNGVIASILDKMKMEIGYKEFYKLIVSELQSYVHGNVKQCAL